MARALRIRKVLAVPSPGAADADTLYLVKEANGGVNPILYTRSKGKYAKAVRSILVTGSKILYQSVAGQAVQGTYTIANFDSFTTYTVTVSAGSVSVNGATITVTSPTTTGVISLTINGEVTLITVLPPSVKAPSISYPTYGLSKLGTSFTATTSAFAVSTGSDTMVSVEWQVSPDASFFSNVINGSLNGAGTTFTVTGLNYATTYYLRARHKGTNKGYSAWSTPVKFSTQLTAVGATEQASLVSLTAQADELFSTGLALSGDGLWAAVGAPGGKSNGNAYGYVDLYQYRAGSWVRKQRVLASDPLVGSKFGTGLALSHDGEYLAVGAPAALDGSTASGAVYLYNTVNGSYNFVQKLVPPSSVAGDSFGAALAFSSSGGHLVIGAPGREPASYANEGVAYVYAKSGTTWSYQATLDPTEGNVNTYIGTAVAISEDGSVVVVGCNADASTTLPNGAAFVFTRTGTTWTQTAKLSPAAYSAGMKFGNSVAISLDGLWIAVGAPSYTAGGVTIGAVFLYRNLNGTWTGGGILYPDTTAITQAFGTSVALNQDGSRLAIGEPLTGSTTGRVYLYSRSGIVWTFGQKLARTGAAALDRLGTKVRLDAVGTKILASSPTNSASVSNGGSAYFFK